MNFKVLWKAIACFLGLMLVFFLTSQFLSLLNTPSTLTVFIGAGLLLVLWLIAVPAALKWMWSSPKTINTKTTENK